MSTDTYPVIVRLRDEFGNIGVINASIPVDIIVIKEGNGYRIENSRIYFQDFTADFKDVSPELSKQNIKRLDQLAAKLKVYPDYKISIVGHAVMINWANKELGAVEQKNVLIPLSKARAEAIKAAIVERGVDPAMITTQGVGADEQLVPDSDYPNRWRNRRTAIFLVK